MEVGGKDAERRSSANARVRRGQSWKAWAEDLDDHLRAIDVLFSPSLIIVGGGISKKGDRFLPFLKTPVPIVAAQLRNEAGIVGAAMVGLERENEMLREEQDVAERGRPDPPPAPLKVVPSVPAAEAG
jgi:polyphosphate glucokinase